MSNQTYNEESRGVAMNIFAVLGFIAILLAGLWATVQLVKQVSSLSFDFNKPTISMPTFGNGDKLAIVANTDTLRSGESAKVAWSLGKEARSAEGSTLNFSYACKAGAYVKVLDVDTESYRAIPCNAPYNVPTTDSELSIIPVLTTIEAAELAYSLTYTPATEMDEDAQVVNGTLTITKGDALVMEPDTTVPTTDEEKEGAMSTRTTVPAPRVMQKKTVTTLVPVRKSDPNGLPDLTVNVLEVHSADNTGKVVVKFEVANLGTKLANAWTFTSTLPTEPAYTYVSEAQGTLYAGERAEMLMTFDKLKLGTNALTITVDAQDAIVESLETNNAVTQSVVGK